MRDVVSIAKSLRDYAQGQTPRHGRYGRKSGRFQTAMSWIYRPNYCGHVPRRHTRGYCAGKGRGSLILDIFQENMSELETFRTKTAPAENCPASWTPCQARNAMGRAKCIIPQSDIKSGWTICPRLDRTDMAGRIWRWRAVKEENTILQEELARIKARPALTTLAFGCLAQRC